nr:hypothetical protein [Treponema sp.]
MSSSVLKKVLIADSSHTMTNILAMQLKDIYDVSISYDGCDALRCLLTNEYDCALLSIDLPVLGGFSLTRIIKKTASIRHVAVVCFSSEDNFSKRLFWSSGAGVDEIYVITDDEGESLRNCIKKALSVASGELESSTERTIQKKAEIVDLLPVISTAYEKQLFEYYVLQFAYSCNVQIQDLQGLKSLQELKLKIQQISLHIVQQMAECLFGICNYSSLLIFINLDAVDGTVLEFKDISAGLSNEVKIDFENICKSDFEKAEMDRTDHDYNAIDILDSYVADDKSSSLQSYEYFLLATDEFSGSIHIAQRLQNYFGNKYHDRIVYFAEVFSPIIENVVKSYRSKCIEIQMKLAFSRFVPEEIINDLMTNENSVIERGATRNICIFIVDIRDFTSISEINEPSEVVDFLNTYFTRAVEIVKKYGGTVDKFMGDAIMALFGAPENLLRKASADDKTEINCSCALAAAVELIHEYPKIPVNQIKIPSGKKF